MHSSNLLNVDALAIVTASKLRRAVTWVASGSYSLSWLGLAQRLSLHPASCQPAPNYGRKAARPWETTTTWTAIAARIKAPTPRTWCATSRRVPVGRSHTKSSPYDKTRLHRHRHSSCSAGVGRRAALFVTRVKFSIALLYIVRPGVPGETTFCAASLTQVKRGKW